MKVLKERPPTPSCLFAETDPEKANVLDLGQWKFWVVPTATIERELGDQKSLSPPRLESIAKPLDFDDLRHSIEKSMSV